MFMEYPKLIENSFHQIFLMHFHNAEQSSDQEDRLMKSNCFAGHSLFMICCHAFVKIKFHDYNMQCA